MKVVIVNTSKGKYHVDLEFVAKHRADYYAGVDDYEIGSDGWKSEVSYVMEDRYEGEDWLSNNMNWDDFKEVAVPVEDEEEDFWFEADGIIEI